MCAVVTFDSQQHLTISLRYFDSSGNTEPHTDLVSTNLKTIERVRNYQQQYSDRCQLVAYGFEREYIEDFDHIINEYIYSF